MAEAGLAGMASPLGGLVLRHEGPVLLGIRLGGDPAGLPAPPAAIAEPLAAYLETGRWPIPVAYRLAGTDYQRRVWRGLLAIPAGETRSYGRLARSVGGSPRSVGNACRANPLPLVVPCHRVVAAHGPGGFGGSRAGVELERKIFLLALEKPGARPNPLRVTNQNTGIAE